VASPRRPPPSSLSASARLALQGRKDTAPELALRRALHALGYRYAVDAPLPGIPRRRCDLLFGRRKVVVFVDGCFWHGCPQHATIPSANRAWWEDKLRGNRERDRDTDDRLQLAGWTVVRVWEHEDVSEALPRLVGVLGPPHH
jgi:DNA mismatch endonuclease, patch repair protein